MTSPTGRNVACVMAEGGYFHGAAALANSLVAQGFSGTLLVGYRGARPGWASEGMRPAPEVEIRFVALEGDWHLTNLKPAFMLRALREFCPEADGVWYFDADVVVLCPWSNFERWARSGILAVLDMTETHMPADHAYRQEWRALCARAGLGCRDGVAGYVNGGFLGVPRAQAAFLETWQRLHERRVAEGADMRVLVDPRALPEYGRMDQDLLNVARMASDAPFHVLGVEAMGSFPSTGILGHAMVFRKPWVRNYVLDAIKGFQPDIPHAAYWRFANHPIRPFSRGEWLRKRAMLRLTRLIGFLRRRSLRDW